MFHPELSQITHLLSHFGSVVGTSSKYSIDIKKSLCLNGNTETLKISTKTYLNYRRKELEKTSRNIYSEKTKSDSVEKGLNKVILRYNILINFQTFYIYM